MNSEKKKIDSLKGIIFPLLTTFLLTIFIFNNNLSSFLVGKQDLSKFTDMEIQRLQIYSGFSMTFLLLGTEIVLKSFKKVSYQVEIIPFIRGFRNRDWIALFLQYPLTLLFEELLFRGLFYAMWPYPVQIEFLVLINACFFGIYHIHVFLTTKNIKIASIFITFSFFLAIPLGLIFLYFGVIGSWIFHLLVVTYVYLRWNSLKTKWHYDNHRFFSKG